MEFLATVRSVAQAKTTIILHCADGVPHRVEVTAFPLDGQGGDPVGAMSIFWEADVDS